MLDDHTPLLYLMHFRIYTCDAFARVWSNFSGHKYKFVSWTLLTKLTKNDVGPMWCLAVNQACKNRFGNDFWLWLSMVLRNWLCDSQLHWDPSSFSSYSMIFLAINHLLAIIDGIKTSGMAQCYICCSPCERTRVWFPISAHVFQFWYATINRGRQLEVSTKSLIQQ